MDLTKMSTKNLEAKLLTATTQEEKNEIKAIINGRAAKPAQAKAVKEVKGEESVDDLLGDIATPDEKPVVVKDGKVVSGDGELPDSKEAGGTVKETKEPKPPRVLKGTPVTFKTKGTGQQITGLGVLYYVVRFQGRLYYKEASQVTHLDALPADLDANPDIEVAMPDKVAPAEVVS